MASATERRLVGLVRWAAVHPRWTLALLVVATVVLGLGLARLRFRTELLDYLPGDHDGVAAFGRVLETIDGVTNQELLWLELDPQKAGPRGIERMTDEGALRAQERLARFVQTRVPAVRHVFGLPLWVHLARYGGSGQVPEDLTLPASSTELTAVWNAVWLTQRELVEVALSEDGQAAVMGFVIEGDPMSSTSRDIGLALLAAIEEARLSPEPDFDLFRAELLHPVGLASGMARIDASLHADVLRLAPLAVLITLGMLFVAFRDLRAVLVGVTTLLTGVVWVYGLMGWLDVGINVVNIALVPLILGNGIDFAIHVLNEYQEERARSAGFVAAFAAVASRAGMALLLTTLITVGGLLALCLSGVPGIVELGLFAAFGLTSLGVLVLTLPPALLAFDRRGAVGGSFRPSRFMQGTLSALAGPRRRLGVVLIALLTLASLGSWRETEYQLDIIQGSFPQDDPVTRVVEAMRSGMGGAFPEFLIVDGDLTDPDTIATCTRLVDELEQIGGGGRILDPVRLLGSHAVLQGGPLAAAARLLANGGDLTRAVPTDSDSLRAALTAMHAHPVWSPLVNLVSSRDLDRAVIVFFPPVTNDTLAAAGALWDELTGLLERTAADQPASVSTSFLGYRTMTYLFIQTSLFWMRTLLVICLAIACLLVWVFTGRVRYVLAVAAIMILGSVWWFGMLQLFGIYISVFLLFPIVFLVCIGSDHALHLIWGLERRRDPRQVYGTTGKAVLFSALTDAAVFFVFAAMYLVSASQVMLATGLAVLAIFLGTLLALPALVPERNGRGPGPP